MLRLNFANTVSRYGIALLAEFRGIAPGRWGAGSSHSAARQPALAHWTTLCSGAVRNFALRFSAPTLLSQISFLWAGVGWIVWLVGPQSSLLISLNRIFELSIKL
ncbi:Hypp9267 [Branchiostoma lanceolatum]|uniref:Hypp9267 protein n=1 Tax=Branchiostoma lanceolatum TaxID=7740 RepID=A0A8J9ZFH5_BRALA|nr:Hypp9267 [Branchiostoma lanceolatum]